MPAIFAHYSFGMQAVARFAPEMQRVVRSHEAMYRMGLQGPDFYFFDQLEMLRGRHLSRVGSAIHRDSCAALLARLKGSGHKRLDSAALAYVIGLVGHFTLDSTCHPHIDAWVETLPYEHMRMETEFDRYLLEQAGEDARRYPLGDCIRAGKRDRLAVGALYADYSAPDETAALICDFRLIKNLLRTPYDWQYALVQGILRRVPDSAPIAGVFMGPVDAMSAVTNPRLAALFDEALERYPKLAASAWAYFCEDEALDEYFRRNFETAPEEDGE
ncbi:MAG: zinc dependent phospholipase C family protein [Peptococcaceae bacterium]|nr:zinc dependent phospholipase C family protein [Peptococcaceae bacterium]